MKLLVTRFDDLTRDVAEAAKLASFFGRKWEKKSSGGRKRPEPSELSEESAIPKRELFIPFLRGGLFWRSTRFLPSRLEKVHSRTFVPVQLALSNQTRILNIFFSASFFCSHFLSSHRIVANFRSRWLLGFR